MNEEDPDDSPNASILEALQALPLFEEPYLRMQAMNLDVVDGFLVDREDQLLEEYMELEQTPLPTAVFVSALSQLWIFGLYELLRTWRQRGRDHLRWNKEFLATPEPQREAKLASKKREIEERSAASEGAAVFYWPTYEQAALDPPFAESIRKAIDRTERLFRRIEALRMALAKHELPGVKGSFAMAPGYGRIDMTDGSIYWQIVLEGNEVDLVSRRVIANDCRSLAFDNAMVILPERVQETVKKFPDFSYGVKRVSVILSDGTEHKGVYVGWAKEILRVDGHEAVPFDADHVVDVHHDPVKDREERKRGSDSN